MVDTMERTEQAKATTAKPLREHVLDALKRYFDALAGSNPVGLHNLVLEEVESALYEAIMKFVRGNQSRAARLLGVSRGTLRTKLKQYFGTTHVGLPLE
ncbi:MAG: Fis family transcriptional regulator [Proteobacteria bacterium]|nr:Fis family transcriptional regulator [Pseudomonadota bacterium]